MDYQSANQLLALPQTLSFARAILKYFLNTSKDRFFVNYSVFAALSPFIISLFWILPCIHV